MAKALRMKEGDGVEFDLGEGPKGPRARTSGAQRPNGTAVREPRRGVFHVIERGRHRYPRLRWLRHVRCAAVRAGAGGRVAVHRRHASRSVARLRSAFRSCGRATADVLFAMPDVHLVYIATPPFLHYEQARAALHAGKHVIVEKPLAVTMEQADEIVALARDTRRLLVTNLMQRYNPLFSQIKALVDSKLLGDVLRGTFENYACDEGLGPDHWFWDRTKSGGIFIEHGVHFFDMFAGWLGVGTVESAGRVLRPGSGIEEQVYCTARYGDVPVTFYHGFTRRAGWTVRNFGCSLSVET